MSIIEPEIGTKEERRKLYEAFRKSLDAKLRPLSLVYGISEKDEYVSVKWLDTIHRSTCNDGNDGTGGCWGGTPDPKLCVDFKHELTQKFWGWKVEEFDAFEALCLEKMGIEEAHKDQSNP